MRKVNANIMKTRRIINIIIAIIAIITSISLVSMLVYNGYGAYAEATKTPEVKTNYTNDKADSFPASEFVEKMLSEPASGTDALTRIPIATANVLPESCIQPDMPNSIVYARAASNKDYSIVVQAYGAGQAHINFDDYVKRLTANCNVSINDNTGSDMVSWNTGAIMTAGDALVSILVNDEKKTLSMTEWTHARMESLLSDTNCVAVSESSKDSTRSFYYDASKYIGLKQTEQVSTSKSIITNAIPQSYLNAKGNVNAMYASPVTRNVPESPLPASFPSSLPSAPAKPSFSSIPTVPSSTANIDYQVSDDQGPGCGWKWAGQAMPSFNQKSLNEKYKETKKTTIDAMDASVLAYNSASGNWALESLWKTRFKSQWDEYVKQVQDVEAKWNDLDNKRAAFKPEWNAYVNSVYSWEYERLEHAALQAKWNDEINDCIIIKQNDWKPAATGTTPDDNQKNEWRAECESSHQKPDELKTEQEQEPSAPSIPSDITIPASWMTAQDAKNNAKTDYDKAHADDEKNDDNQSQSSQNGTTGNNNEDNGSNENNNNGNNSNTNNNGSIGGNNNENNGSNDKPGAGTIGGQ